MRARDISLFVICVAISAPLIATTGVWSSNPAGADYTTIAGMFSVSALVGVLAAGGVSIMGWSFKVPAVLTSFMLVYSFCATMLVTLIGQMIHPWEVAVIFAGVFTTLFAVVGYFAALEIAGGPHGGME